MLNFKLSFLVKLFFSFVLIGLISLYLSACNESFEKTSLKIKTNSVITVKNQLSEVSPPDTIRLLNKSLKNYHPKVSITYPKQYEVLSDNTVSVKLKLMDFPLFKNKNLGLGPHLNLFVDNKSYKKIYDLNEPIILEDLDPGTHTIRVLASSPWYESFKTKEAYAQTTFHVFTKIDNNLPNLSLPLLTYNSPRGDYGEEPIMLDFYVFDPSSDSMESYTVEDKDNCWRVKVTINEEIFILDSLEPIYLKGFQPGKNWIRLELIDKYGKKINNVFSDSIQLINYNPNKKDTLSALLQDKLSNQLAYSLIDPKYIKILQLANEEEILPISQLEEITTVENEKISEEIPQLANEEEILPVSQLEEITTAENEKISEEIPRSKWLKKLILLIKKMNLYTIRDFMNNIQTKFIN